MVTRALNEAEARDHASALTFVASWLRQENAGSVRLAAVGHRVSHGGREFVAPVRVDRAVLARLEAYSPLAPLHQPSTLAPMRRLLDVAPELPQVACFDTSFHATQPVVAQLFGLPKSFYDEGVRRYGFHGISYEYIARVLPELAPEVVRSRVVVAHLGSGASMCAMLDLKSVAPGADLPSARAALRQLLADHHPSRRRSGRSGERVRDGDSRWARILRLQPGGVQEVDRREQVGRLRRAGP